MAKTKHIYAAPLDIHFSIIFGSDYEEIKNEFKHQFPDSPDEALELTDAAMSRQFASVAPEIGPETRLNTVMILPLDEDGYIEARTVVHEAVHIAYYLLSARGVKFDDENHEILALLVDYVFEEAVNFKKELHG